MTKSEFEFEIQGFYSPYGWECLTTETDRHEARERLKEYNQNEPNISHRIKRVKSS